MNTQRGELTRTAGEGEGKGSRKKNFFFGVGGGGGGEEKGVFERSLHTVYGYLALKYILHTKTEIRTTVHMCQIGGGDYGGIFSPYTVQYSSASTKDRWDKM